jgi:2-polyprenyl-3-methyl-5-hydroxy-6-metoxy-1,4-benzoquinol methylase
MKTELMSEQHSIHASTNQPVTANWFESWFDTPYYHILYDERDENEASAFIKAIQQKIKTPKKAHVLDAACGQGRHAKTLYEFGFKV